MTIPKYIVVSSAVEEPDNAFDNEDWEMRTHQDEESAPQIANRWQADASLSSIEGQQAPAFRRTKTLDTPPRSPLRSGLRRARTLGERDALPRTLPLDGSKQAHVEQ